MKILCKMRAFSRGRIVKPGELLEMDKCPSWGKIIETVDTQNVENTSVKPAQVGGVFTEVPAENSVQEANNSDQNNGDTDNQEELEKKLDMLLTKGLDLGIMIDGLEKLSIKEQIEKLETEINKKSEEVK